MNELETMYYCDRIQRLSEQAELADDEKGLTLESLELAEQTIGLDEVAV